MQDGPESLPRAKPPGAPGSLQGKVEAVAGSGPCGGVFEGHNPPPRGRAASLPDGGHGGLEGAAVVFDRKGLGRGMSGSEQSDNLIALGRKAAQIGREGAEDGFLPVLVGCDAGAGVLEDLLKV